MYNSIRVIIYCLAALAIIYVRKIVKKKATYIVLSIAIVGLSIFIVASNPENLFYSFPTPEAIFQYKNSIPADFVLEGKNSAEVVAETKKSIKYSIIRDFYIKGNDGYKLSSSDTSKTVLSGWYEDAPDVEIMECSGDYYVEICVLGEKTITDNKNSAFEFIYDENGIFTSAFAYVPDIQNYSIIVDGKEIKIT